MKKILFWLARNWWTGPVALLLLGLVVVLSIEEIKVEWLCSLSFTLWFIVLIFQIVPFLTLLYEGKTGRFVLMLAVMMVLLCVQIPAMFFLALMDAPDDFAKKHPLPDNVKYELPIDRGDSLPEPIIDSTDVNSCLQIWNGIQGGQYEYDFYSPSLPAGTVYLKCYEVVKNDPLSTDRLKASSSVSHPATAGFSKIADKQDFTIYEGNWGEYYAVRVEVWQRDSTASKEHKLMEKVYRMEGWMR